MTDSNEIWEAPPLLAAELSGEDPPSGPLDVWEDDGGAPPCSAAERPQCPRCHPPRRTLKQRLLDFIDSVIDEPEV